MAILISFFSLQPQLPKTDQNLKFILEIWLKIPLSTTLGLGVEEAFDDSMAGSHSTICYI